MKCERKHSRVRSDKAEQNIEQNKKRVKLESAKQNVKCERKNDED